ncbi:MAG: transposase [Chloroflexi bacterium]|nr:transposase [Chloroflexota bacterium]
MIKEPIKRYSQAFKQQVVREYEAGASIYSLRQKYGIGVYKSVKRWIEQYGRAAPSPHPQRYTHPGKFDRGIG